MNVCYPLPDRLDSRGLEAPVARYEWEAEMERSRCDDSVGHVRNNITRNILERIRYVASTGAMNSPEFGSARAERSRSRAVSGTLRLSAR
jgi:hypothetical protein